MSGLRGQQRKAAWLKLCSAIRNSSMCARCYYITCCCRQLLQQQLSQAGVPPGQVLVYCSPFSRTMETARAAAAAAGLDAATCIHVSKQWCFGGGQGAGRSLGIAEDAVHVRTQVLIAQQPGWCVNTNWRCVALHHTRMFVPASPSRPHPSSSLLHPPTHPTNTHAGGSTASRALLWQQIRADQP